VSRPDLTGGPSPRRLRPRLRWRFVAAAVSALVLFWVQRVLSQWVDRTGIFISALALVVALLILLEWVLELALPAVWRLARSLARSFGRAFFSDAEVGRIAARYPRISGWLRRRTTFERPGGFYTSAIVLGAGYFLFGFLSIAEDLATSSAMVGVDQQLSGLLRAFRTPVLTRLLWGFTVLGDPRVATLLTLLALGLLLVWGRRAEAWLVGVTVGGGAIISALAKLAFHRPRPLAQFALIKLPSSFSFPSGHALNSLLFFGVLAFVLVRLTKRLGWRLTILGAAAVAVLLTGLSRVYLGVHWPSDVVASWSLAAAVLSVTCGLYLMRARYRTSGAVTPLGTRTVRLGATIAIALVAVLAVGYGASHDPLLDAAAAVAPTRVWTAAADASGAPDPTAAQIAQLPRFSEKLDGSKQDPIGLVFVGSEAQLMGAFRAAGWSVADKAMPSTLLRAIAAASANQAYATAPVTPTFLSGQVQDVAFEKSDGQATVRRRHHVRWWKTDLTWHGQPVWVATASFDAGLEIGSAIPVPTHRTDPNIDAEQAFTVRSLAAGGQARAVRRISVTTPSTGTDAQGDAWFTQGEATLLVPTR